MTTTSSTREHAEISPSELTYLANCAGYERDEGEGDTYARDRGERLHAGMELLVKGTATVENLEDFGYTPAQAETLERAWSQQLQSLASINGLNKTAPDRFVVMEERLSIAEGTTFGYPDYVCIYPHGRAAFLTDYKFGDVAVPEAANNGQILAYALGIFEKYSYVDTVYAVVIQPSVTGNPHSVAFYREHDVPRIYRKIVTTISLVKELRKNRKIDSRLPQYFNRKLQVGTQCATCRHAFMCGKVNKGAYKIATRYKAVPLGFPKEITDLTTPSSVERAWDAIKILEQWTAKGKQHIYKLFKEGFETDNLTYSERQGNRYISDVAGLWQLLESKYGFTMEDFLELWKVSLSKVEERVREKVVSDVERAILEASIKKGSVAAKAQLDLKKDIKARVEQFKQDLETEALVERGAPVGIVRKRTNK